MYEILKKAVAAPFLFREPIEVQEKEKFEAIKKSFSFHYEKNEYYRRLCEASGFACDDLKSVDDLIKIPLIPIGDFKKADAEARHLLSLPIEQMTLDIHSSGTGGTPSVARRDPDTMTFVTLFYISLFRDFLRIWNGAGLYLIPSPADVPDMGMINTFTLLNYGFGVSAHAVKDKKLDCEKAVSFLREWEGKLDRYIMCPPFILNMFLDYLVKNNIKLKLDKNTKVITVGGWKHHEGSKISRKELDDKCKEYLGIEKHQIRDFYGMVESNFMAFECENNKKHVPVPIHLSIRNIDNPAEEVRDGEKGLVAILDPISLSYPAFLLTEDIGVLHRNVQCECGRVSDVIEIVGRAPKSNLKTCALSLEAFMDEKNNKPLFQ